MMCYNLIFKQSSSMFRLIIMNGYVYMENPFPLFAYGSENLLHILKSVSQMSAKMVSNLKKFMYAI